MQAKHPLLIYGFRDGSESLSRSRFTLRDNTTNMQGMAAATALRAPLQALSDAVIVWQSLTYAMVEDEPVLPPTGSNVQRVGVFLFATAAEGQYAIVEIPGLQLGYLMSTGPAAGIDIDLSDPAIAALISELTSGVWCTRFGYGLTECVTGFLQWRD